MIYSESILILVHPSDYLVVSQGFKPFGSCIIPRKTVQGLMVLEVLPHIPCGIPSFFDAVLWLESNLYFPRCKSCC